MRESGELSSPLDATAHLADDWKGAVEFRIRCSPRDFRAFRRERNQRLEAEEKKCEWAARSWRAGLPESQKLVRGKLSPPLLARLLDMLEIGGQSWLPQCTSGFPAVGNLSEPGVYLVDTKCTQPGLD